jgi:hypothetical protein
MDFNISHVAYFFAGMIVMFLFLLAVGSILGV